MQVLLGPKSTLGIGASNNTIRSKTSDELDATNLRQVLESKDTSKQTSVGVAEAAQAGTISKDILTLSSVNNLISITEDALSQIKDLREKQQELTDLVANSPETYTGDTQAARDEELDTLQTEITRIVSAASYNGQNLLQSPTTVSATLINFSLPGLPGGTTQEVLSAGVGNTNSLSQSLGADASSVAQATSSNTTLEALIAGARGFTDGIAGEQDITEASLTDIPTFNALQNGDRKSKLNNIKEAEKLAKQVADEISALPDKVTNGNFPSAASGLISFSTVGLDPYRVKQLLEE